MYVCKHIRAGHETCECMYIYTYIYTCRILSCSKYFSSKDLEAWYVKQIAFKLSSSPRARKKLFLNFFSDGLFLLNADQKNMDASFRTKKKSLSLEGLSST
jgi:hypothetical protein